MGKEWGGKKVLVGNCPQKKIPMSIVFLGFFFGKDTLILTASAYFEFNQMAEEIPSLFIAPLQTAPFMGGDQAL